MAAEIEVSHLMPLAAIPFLFSPVRINREYFGDGSMCQIAPISPALHLGAERATVISVSNADLGRERIQTEHSPSLAQVAGHALNSIFLAVH